jgi:hypothetical protein
MTLETSEWASGNSVFGRHASFVIGNVSVLMYERGSNSVLSYTTLYHSYATTMFWNLAMLADVFIPGPSQPNEQRVWSSQEL